MLLLLLLDVVQLSLLDLVQLSLSMLAPEPAMENVHTIGNLHVCIVS